MNTEENSDPRREDVCPAKKGKLDLDAAREKLAGTNGLEYWRSLEELAGSPDFQEMLHREFPKGASEWLDSVSRRGFLKLMGASLAMAGMTACTKQPLEPIVPYVKQPEEIIQGGRYSLPPRLRWADTPARFWSRVIFIVPQRLKEMTGIRPASAGPISSPRHRSSECTTPIAQRLSPILAMSEPGAIW